MEANRRSDSAVGKSPAGILPFPKQSAAGHRAPSMPAGQGVIARDEVVEADLNAFFPFDPYKLPLSLPYVEPVYRDWSEVAMDNLDSDEEGEDEEDSSDSEGVSDGNGETDSDSSGNALEHRLVPIYPSDDLAKVLGQSFGGMSISPLQSGIHHRS